VGCEARGVARAAPVPRPLGWPFRFRPAPRAGDGSSVPESRSAPADDASSRADDRAGLLGLGNGGGHSLVSPGVMPAHNPAFWPPPSSRYSDAPRSSTRGAGSAAPTAAGSSRDLILGLLDGARRIEQEPDLPLPGLPLDPVPFPLSPMLVTPTAASSHPSPHPVGAGASGNGGGGGAASPGAASRPPPPPQHRRSSRRPAPKSRDDAFVGDEDEDDEEYDPGASGAGGGGGRRPARPRGPPVAGTGIVLAAASNGSEETLALGSGRPFQCGACGQVFESASLLRRHTRSHIQSASRPRRAAATESASSSAARDVFSCPMGCVNARGEPLSWSYRQTLKDHIDLDHAGKVLLCPIPGCNKRYKKRNSRAQHMRRKHNIKNGCSAAEFARYNVPSDPVAPGRLGASSSSSSSSSSSAAAAAAGSGHSGESGGGGEHGDRGASFGDDGHDQADEEDDEEEEEEEDAEREMTIRRSIRRRAATLAARNGHPAPAGRSFHPSQQQQLHQHQALVGSHPLHPHAPRGGGASMRQGGGVQFPSAPPLAMTVAFDDTVTHIYPPPLSATSTSSLPTSSSARRAPHPHAHHHHAAHLSNANNSAASFSSSSAAPSGHSPLDAAASEPPTALPTPASARSARASSRRVRADLHIQTPGLDLHDRIEPPSVPAALTLPSPFVEHDLAEQ
jgi:hypothetical protein